MNDKIWRAKSNLSIEFCLVSPVDNVMLQLYLMSRTVYNTVYSYNETLFKFRNLTKLNEKKKET